LKHEGNVFENDPRNAPTVQQPENFSDEARAGTADPCRSPSLAQVLARKASNDQLDVGRKIL